MVRGEKLAGEWDRNKVRLDRLMMSAVQFVVVWCVNMQLQAFFW